MTPLRLYLGIFLGITLAPTHIHLKKTHMLKGWREMDQTRDQEGWSASLCVLIVLIYFLPPVDSKESCLDPFRVIVSMRNQRVREVEKERAGRSRVVHFLVFCECTSGKGSGRSGLRAQDELVDGGPARGKHRGNSSW